MPFWCLDSIQLWSWNTGITHLTMDDLMLSDFLIYHTSGVILGHIPFRLRFLDLYGVAWSPPLTRYMLRQWLVCYLIMILWWSLSWAIQIDPHFSAFGCHCASLSGIRLFDLRVRFSYGRGWLGLHIWWWMIWCHLIFQPIPHFIPYWGIFPLWLRFVDSPLICMIIPSYEIRIELMICFHFVLILKWSLS